MPEQQLPQSATPFCFAPPIDEHMERYGQILDNHPDPHVRRIGKQLHAGVAALLSHSDRFDPATEREHPVENLRGPTGDFVVPVIRNLRKNVHAAVEEHLVSQDEIAAYWEMQKKLPDAEAARRNALKSSAWKRTVGEALFAKMHGLTRTDFLAQQQAKLTVLNAMRNAAPFFDAQIPALQAECDALAQKEEAWERARCRHCRHDSAEGKALVPYPEMEDASASEAFGHLIWYMAEMVAGREPCTNEMVQ